MDNFKEHKNLPRHLVIVTSLLLLFVMPFPAFPQGKEGKESIDILRQTGKAFAKIAEKASPAVVSIEAQKTVTRELSPFEGSPFGDQGDPFGDDFWNYFFYRRSPSPRQRTPRTPQRRQDVTTAKGSGFIISADGYILSNNHLVGEAEKVNVELVDGRKFIAKKIGSDPETDVAVVKIDAGNLPYLELADSDTLEVGEWVLAIGNPLGLSHTVTAGIVSAKGRSGLNLDTPYPPTYQNFIQTDAAINFGNSGGPLINLDGKVVGINTAIVGPGGNIGIGFAIPINMAKNIADQLMAGKGIERGFLGVQIQDLDPNKAEFFDLKDTKGVVIPEVTEGSAADKAGLKHDDVILEINGEPVESADAFRNRVAMLKPGTDVKLTIWRDGKKKTITATLAKRPPLEELMGIPEAAEVLGFSVRDLTDDLASRYGYKGQSGVIVTEVEQGSQADRVGIAQGSLIKEVNRAQVHNTKEFNEEIEKAREKGAVLLLVKRERYTFYALLAVPKK
jgi:serine protease Do